MEAQPERLTRKISQKSERKFTAESIRLDFKKRKNDYLMVLPAFAFFIIFHYLPMYGILMAFSDYRPKIGIFRSFFENFVGLKHFESFFSSIYFSRLLSNTIIISVLNLLFTFFAAIIFALLLNEVKIKLFSKGVSVVAYMPHFISLVILSGILVDFCRTDGVLGTIMEAITGKSQNLLAVSDYWRAIYVGSELWQQLGFSSIIFVAALAGVDQELYEAASLDGAGHLRKVWHVTLPGIMSTIILVLIMRIGMIMALGADKTILLYNSQIYEKADIIASYVYRRGLLNGDYSFSTAVGLFNSIVNLTLIIFSNRIAKKYSDYSLF